MSVFLGHPVYALSVVLFSLILSTGFGSMASEGVRLDGAGKLVAWSVAIARPPTEMPGAVLNVRSDVRKILRADGLIPNGHEHGFRSAF